MINIIDYKNGSNNKSPIISNLKVVGEPTQSSIKISYHVEDTENQIVRHYLTIPNLYDKKEITPEVGYDKNDFEYNITGLEMGKTYSIMITCFDGLNEGKSDAIQRKTESIIVWGVRINEANSNPETSVTYIEQSVGMTPAKGSNWGSWENKWPFNLIRPCGFKNGSVYKYINKDNHTLYEDGSVVGEDVDVMIEFPKIYWKFTNDGTHIDIRISNKKNDNGYMCLAHMINGVEFNNLYISEYESSFVNGKLRSLPNKTPESHWKIGQFRQYAQANGKGYQQFLYYQAMLLEILYLIMYKNLDSQTALGKGIVESEVKIDTGTLASEGMLYGTTSGIKAIKFLGIENWYGNQYEWTDGLYYDSSKNILISKQNTFNDNGNGYENSGQAKYFSIKGFLSKIQGTTKAGFLVREVSGSESTFYCDYAGLNSNSVSAFGGGYQYNFRHGAFSWYTDIPADYSGGDVGARLSYIG